MDNYENKPIYAYNAEKTREEGAPACDYSSHPLAIGGLLNPLNLEEGGVKLDNGLWGYPGGVLLPFKFCDNRDKSGDQEPFGGFGWQNWDVKGIRHCRFHNGTDHPEVAGTDVRATKAGVVVCADDEDRTDLDENDVYGKGVVIFNGTTWRVPPGETKPRKYNVYAKYCHLSKVLVETGQWVEVGQVIGLVGNTGKSGGNHLHYAIMLLIGLGILGNDMNVWTDWRHHLDPRITDMDEIEQQEV